MYRECAAENRCPICTLRVANVESKRSLLNTIIRRSQRFFGSTRRAHHRAMVTRRGDSFPSPRSRLEWNQRPGENSSGGGAEIVNWKIDVCRIL
jgi:hypothetical protein